MAEVEIFEQFECVDEKGQRFFANATQIREQGFKRVVPVAEPAPPVETPVEESRPRRRGGNGNGGTSKPDEPA